MTGQPGHRSALEPASGSQEEGRAGQTQPFWQREAGVLSLLHAPDFLPQEAGSPASPLPWQDTLSLMFSWEHRQTDIKPASRQYLSQHLPETQPREQRAGRPGSLVPPTAALALAKSGSGTHMATETPSVIGSELPGRRGV